MTTTTVTLTLRGPRLLAAADWMIDKPVPEEIDGEGLAVWQDMGVSLNDEVLSIPAHLLADFIEEIENGIEISLAMVDDPYQGGEAKAHIRALRSLIDKLEGLPR